MEAQQRFIDLFGLECYTKLILKNSEKSFEELVKEDVFRNVLLVYKRCETEIVEVTFGQHSFYCFTKPGNYTFPDAAVIKKIKYDVGKLPVEKFNIRESICGFVISGKFGKWQTILKNIFCNRKFIAAVLNDEQPGEPNEYCRNKLSSYGYSYVAGQWELC